MLVLSLQTCKPIQRKQDSKNVETCQHYPLHDFLVNWKFINKVCIAMKKFNVKEMLYYQSQIPIRYTFWMIFLKFSANWFNELCVFSSLWMNDVGWNIFMKKDTKDFCYEQRTRKLSSVAVVLPWNKSLLCRF